MESKGIHTGFCSRDQRRVFVLVFLSSRLPLEECWFTCLGATAHVVAPNCELSFRGPWNVPKTVGQAWLEFRV